MTRTTPPRPLDIEQIFPELAAHRATSTRLHPRPGAPKPHDSSIGGPLLWPADEPWPTCQHAHPRSRGRRVPDVYRERAMLREAENLAPGTGFSEEDRALLAGLREEHQVSDVGETAPVPLLPVAQFFTKGVPGLEAPRGTDLVQVLWCPFDGHGPQGTVAVDVRWRDSSRCGQVLATPPLPEVVGFDGYVPEPCAIAPEQVVEHEYIELLDADLQERIEEWEMRLEEEAEDDDEGLLSYQGDLSIAPGWKVGGFAAWNVTGPAEITCSCGSPMRLFLTIATYEWGGIVSSWTPLEDRRTPAPQDNKHPTAVLPGRDGALNVFACATDPRHEHLLVPQ
ncbi:hypothetical protein [Streptomyces sclerotialus]|uniref:hypothetical protein n=1 Tax=Streptomyces sclerotialus TaxID=1957 RepID=UPI0004C4F0B7